ncbi:unnamed protein product [Polarella glacialis]|uniref:ABC transporter domain-containing protein n=1 Tax=Polarella glacialis TaxID=89957 RepID=A0A813K9Y9_POLGL|nr:unnamed protein product [Polarella glacialis]
MGLPGLGLALPCGAPARACGAPATSWGHSRHSRLACSAGLGLGGPASASERARSSFSFSWASVPVALVAAASLRRRSLKLALKAGKGGKGKKSKGGDSRPTKVSEGAAYAQETRKIILALDNVDKLALDGTPILKGVSLGMYLGAKIGILGKNGAGKSTVMNILAGKDEKFNGHLHIDPSIRIGYLEQEPVLEEETCIECLEPAVKPIRSMLAEFEAVSTKMTEPDADIDALMVEMDTLQGKIDACNGWDLDSK